MTHNPQSSPKGKNPAAEVQPKSQQVKPNGMLEIFIKTKDGQTNKKPEGKNRRQIITGLNSTVPTITLNINGLTNAPIKKQETGWMDLFYETPCVCGHRQVKRKQKRINHRHRRTRSRSSCTVPNKADFKSESTARDGFHKATTGKGRKRILHSQLELLTPLSQQLTEIWSKSIKSQNLWFLVNAVHHPDLLIFTEPKPSKCGTHVLFKHTQLLGR